MAAWYLMGRFKKLILQYAPLLFFKTPQYSNYTETIYIVFLFQNMSRKYERKTLRASWSAEDLDEAMRSVRSKEMGVNQASKHFKIPSRTLRRHLITGRSKVPLGRHPVFSVEHEKKLVAHIKKLERVGFAPERKDVKEMAFQLAKKLNIKNPFSEESELAGNVWFTGFMERNPELSQRKSEGLSLSRAYGVNREDVKDFFNLLETIYEEHDFSNHPEDVFNMDESGIQINNKPGKVVASKGARDVYTLTSSEKGENVTVIACCNGLGNFLPPVLIYKGTYNKPQFSEGLPPGSQVYMNKKSSYINTDLFMKWFEEVFLRHKSSRMTLLILDGHSSHSNNIRLLEIAKENNVILLCLPSHTTHALQPLDRAFFRPLKMYFAQEAKAWMVRCKDKKLTRYDVSKLIGRAWGKAATNANGVSALRSCGIYPFNPTAIPDHYFALSDSIRAQDLPSMIPSVTQQITNEENENSRGSPSLLEQNYETELIHENDVMSVHVDLPTYCDLRNENIENVSSLCSQPNNATSTEPRTINIEEQQTPQDLNSLIFTGLNPSTLCNVDTLSLIEQEPEISPDLGLSQFKNMIPNTPEKQKIKDSSRVSALTNFTAYKSKKLSEDQETPTKLLTTIHPIPKIPVMSSKRKQKAIVLTSTENIEKRKIIASKKKPKGTEIHTIEKARKKVYRKRNDKKNYTNQNSDSDQAKNHKLTTNVTARERKPKKKDSYLKLLDVSEGEISKSDQLKTNEKAKIAMKRKPENKNDSKYDEDRTDTSSDENLYDNKKNDIEEDKRSKLEKFSTEKKKPRRAQPKNRNVFYPSSSETDDEIDNRTDISEEEFSDMDENKCIECTENYYKTKSSEDWIQCSACSGWLHEFCTMYGRFCNICGRKDKRETVKSSKI